MIAGSVPDFIEGDRPSTGNEEELPPENGSLEQPVIKKKKKSFLSRLFSSSSSRTSPASSSRQMTSTHTGESYFAIMGDVMLGRLIDQMFPTHNTSPEDAEYANSCLRVMGQRRLTSSYVWGDMLKEIKSARFKMLNLETAITTSDDAEEGKVFTFRMHPDNVTTLQEIGAPYCSLANNHILDFGVKGMRQTVKVLSDVGITHSGAGENIVSAFQPATTFIENWNGEENRTIEIASFSFTDHPEEWTAQRNTPGVAYVNVAEVMANPGRLLAIKDMIREAKASGVLLVTVSIHWGPNYKWEPEKHFTEFARALIDAGADLIHGTSSHHFQGVELYHDKPILYGCGDFIDDYAVDDEYRNNLGFLFKLHIDEGTNQWTKLSMVPTKLERFQVRRRTQECDSLKWHLSKMRELCGKLSQLSIEQEGTSLVVYLNRVAPVATLEPKKREK